MRQSATKTISTVQFRQAYQRQVDLFARRFGQRLTPAQAKAFGVERDVISRLTGAAALDNHVRDLDLALSEATVERDIRNDPTFQTTSGNFDRGRFDDVLRSLGYSENGYFELRRKETIRGQLTDAVLRNVTPPKAMMDLYQTFNNEKRIASYVALDAKRDIKLGEASDEALKKTYDDNKRRFVTPEFRKFQILMLTSDAAKAKLKITDEDIKQRYERNKDAYAVAEERRVQQIPFKDEAAAEAAREEILGGKDFLEVAKANGAKESDVNLGLLRKSQMIDPKIADAAFALEKDKVSEVTKGRLSTVLLRVTEIKAGKQRTLDEVKDEIRGTIATERVAEKIQELQNQVDDNRLAGKDLKEIAGLLKIPFADVEKANAQGNKPDSKPAFESPDRVALTRAVFDAEVGVEKEVIELSDGGYAWINLIAVIPEKQKPFDTVKADVKKLWVELETAKQMREKAEALVKRIEGGESLADVAKALKADVKQTPEFKRGDSLPAFSRAAITKAFALPVGIAGEAPGNKDSARLVMIVSKIIPPKAGANKQQSEQLNQQLAQALRTDVVAQYVANLQADMGGRDQPATDRPHDRRHNAATQSLLSGQSGPSWSLFREPIGNEVRASGIGRISERTGLCGRLR